jgi:hypothetical protein
MPHARIDARLLSLATLLLVASLSLPGRCEFYTIPEIYTVFTK